MRRTNKVAIIIVNYNGNNDTLECLESIDKYCRGNEYTVYLVDNGSRCFFEEAELSRFHVRIQPIISPNNLGFAGGNNLAINRIGDGEYDYVFLLNNDTVLVDDSVDRLVWKLNEQPKVIGGIVNYFYNAPHVMWQAGSLIRATRFSGKNIRGFDTSSDDLFFVDAIPGSSMMIPWEVIKKCGLFDARYFAYFEEVDLCERARRNGYRVAFLPNSRLLHKVGRSSTSRLQHYLRSRNSLLFYSLYFNKLMWVAYLRIYMRTIRNTIKSHFKIDFLSPARQGVIDYKRGRWKDGSITMFVNM